MNKFNYGNGMIISKKDLFDELQVIINGNILNILKSIYDLSPYKIATMRIGNDILLSDTFKIERVSGNKIKVKPGIAYASGDSFIILSSETEVTIPSIDGIYGIYIKYKSDESITGKESFAPNLTYSITPTVKKDSCEIVVSLTAVSDSILIGKVLVSDTVIPLDVTHSLDYDETIKSSNFSITTDRPTWMSDSFNIAYLIENNAIEHVTVNSARSVGREANGCSVIYYNNPTLVFSPILDMRHLSCLNARISIDSAVQTLLNMKSNETHTHSNATDLNSGFMSNEDKAALDEITAVSNNIISLATDATWKDQNGEIYNIHKSPVPEIPSSVTFSPIIAKKLTPEALASENTMTDISKAIASVNLYDTYSINLSWTAPTKQYNSQETLHQKIKKYYIRRYKLKEALSSEQQSELAAGSLPHELSTSLSIRKYDESYTAENIITPGATTDLTNADEHKSAFFEVKWSDYCIFTVIPISEYDQMGEAKSIYVDVRSLKIDDKTIEYWFKLYAGSTSSAVDDIVSGGGISNSTVTIKSVTGLEKESPTINIIGSATVTGGASYKGNIKWVLRYSFESQADNINNSANSIEINSMSNIITIPKPNAGSIYWLGDEKSAYIYIYLQARNVNETSNSAYATQTCTAYAYNYINTADVILGLNNDAFVTAVNVKHAQLFGVDTTPSGT